MSAMEMERVTTADAEELLEIYAPGVREPVFK